MTEPRDKDNWAKHIEALRLGEIPPGALSATVEGRRVTGPLQGFGRLWQRTYRVKLGEQVDPTEVIRAWKDHYDEFWPESNHFYAPLGGIEPGEVGLISGESGPMRLSTGVLVLYADATSFTYMTPEGHPFAGWVTFSAHREDQGGTVAQVQVLMRPSDPLFEVAFYLGLSRLEDGIWRHTLRSLARHFDRQAEPSTEIVCVDRKRQWRNARNVRWNAGIRTLLNGLGSMFGRRTGGDGYA